MNNCRVNLSPCRSLRFEPLEDRSLLAAGMLDAGFGSGGSVETDFNGNSEVANSVALQSDGKIVVAGSTSDGATRDFLLARYNADGTLDETFGTSGQVVTDFGRSDGAASLALQSNGKIVAAGHSYNGNHSDFALARYNSDGTLDTTFGIGGKVITDFSQYADVGISVVVQSDGKIVVAGNSNNGSKNIFAVARYNVDGTLDTSFDGDGKLHTDFGQRGKYSGARAVALQSDGKMIVGGSIEVTDLNWDFGLARYNVDGTLDTSFHLDGKVTTSFGPGADEPGGVVIQSDGKIVAAGVSSPDSRLALVRYNTDGTLDTSFDGDGRVLTPRVDVHEEFTIASVALQSDGKILLAGHNNDAVVGKSDIFLARYNTNGKLDTSFGDNGKVKTDFSFFTKVYASGRGMVVQNDGKIVVAGNVTPSGVHDGNFLLLRYEGNPITPPALPGDYNRSGTVDAADFILWRNSQGMSLAPFNGADGDGNGTIDRNDYDLWKANFGRTLATATSAALSDQSASPWAASNDLVAEPPLSLMPAAIAATGTSRTRTGSSRPLVRNEFASAELHDNALLAWLAAQPIGRSSEPLTPNLTELLEKQERDEGSNRLRELQLVFAS